MLSLIGYSRVADLGINCVGINIISLPLHSLTESLLPKNHRLRVKADNFIALCHERRVFGEMYDFI